MRFERLIVYHDPVQSGAALNMAIDEAIFAQAQQPSLRFYGWKHPAFSFGYFGKFREAADAAKSNELVRRWTGGGIVPHGADLTYSLVTPASHPVAKEGPHGIYAALHEAIRVALSSEGYTAALATEAQPKISDACFANPVRYDLMLNGLKIAGAAQRRTRAGFLHQGSIQLPHLSPEFRRRFAGLLAGKISEEEVPRSILQNATRLVREKYGTEAWLRRY
jgi:lipoate-protein ligase A